jgi:hypothetical protein
VVALSLQDFTAALDGASGRLPLLKFEWVMKFIDRQLCCCC